MFKELGGGGATHHCFCKENEPQPVKVNQLQTNNEAWKSKLKCFSYFIFIILWLNKTDLSIKVNIKIHHYKQKY
jgi:hypothetical protein